jgi:hypothetical protein
MNREQILYKLDRLGDKLAALELTPEWTPAHCEEYEKLDAQYKELEQAYEGLAKHA